LGLFLSLLVWVLILYFRGFISFELCCVSLGVHAVMMLIDPPTLIILRSVAQTIPYEVSLAFILLSCPLSRKHFQCSSRVMHELTPQNAQ
jgi:hypothetical protein